MLEIMI
jgi:dynein heavy chain